MPRTAELAGRPAIATTLKLAGAGTRRRLALTSANRNDRLYYLAFGSNLSLAQLRRRAPSACPKARYELEGWALGMGGYGVATLGREPSGRAAAVLFSMTREDLRKMDAHEGLARTFGIYRRHKVALGDGTQANTYLIKDGIVAGMLPAQDYHRTIGSALAYWGFGRQHEQFVGLGYEKPGNELEAREALRSWHKEANENFVEPAQAFGHSPTITSKRATPAHNFRQAAYVLAQDGARLHELLMEAQDSILEMFFFYGIFTDANTRRRAGIGSKTVKATLENFALMPRSHMNVEYEKGSSAPGIVANLDPLAIEEVDMVESTPSYYRREQVNLLIALRNGKFLDTLVKVNFYTMQL